MFAFLYHCEDFYRTWQFNTRVSYKKWLHPWFCCSSVLLIFLVVHVVLLCVFTFLVPCCLVHYDFHIKRCSVRLCLQLFVWELMSYCVLCLCLRILMSSILLLLIFLVFFVLFFVLFVFVLYRMCLLLPISLYCPFLISLSGFTNVYLAYYDSVSEWL